MQAALDPLGWLDARERQRTAAGLRRRLRPRTPPPAAGSGTLDLAGNDYLGLCRHPEVVAAAAQAARDWGAGSTGSRLVTGSTTLHADLEAALAGHVGAPAALVFSSGYLANLGVVTALAGQGDLVVSDAGNHASIVDGCRLSGARSCVVPHRDVGAVAAALENRPEERALVVTDAVFSVDGDLAPLAALHAVTRSCGAVLVIDEAHALGVVGDGGRGAAWAAGLAGEPDVVLTATLSKALGSQGGVALGSRRVIDHLVDSARSFVFDTALAPPAVAAARSALRILTAAPALSAGARAGARALAALAEEAGLAARVPVAAVVGVPMGSPARALWAAAKFADHGVAVGCFRPPSVPDGISRLRLTARADLGPRDYDRVRSAFAVLAHDGPPG